MADCPSPKCEERIEEKLKEHHKSLYGSDGLISLLTEKLETIRTCIFDMKNTYMKKFSPVTWIGTIMIIASAAVTTGYNVYSAEYRFASRDQIIQLKEESKNYDSKMNLRISNIETTLDIEKSLLLNEITQLIEDQKKERAEFLITLKKITK